MLKAAWELLRDSGRVLLEAAPKSTDLDDIRAYLLATDHIHDVMTCTPGPSPPACQPCQRTSSSTSPASAMGTHPGSWTSCKPAWPGTSTSSTPHSSSKPQHTPATKVASTDEQIGVEDGLDTMVRDPAGAQQPAHHRRLIVPEPAAREMQAIDADGNHRMVAEMDQGLLGGGTAVAPASDLARPARCCLGFRAHDGSCLLAESAGTRNPGARGTRAVVPRSALRRAVLRGGMASAGCPGQLAGHSFIAWSGTR
jgi:hypothetical protein